MDKMSKCVEEEEDRAKSVMSDCLSMKSDWSKGLQPDFRKEPGPSEEGRAKSVMSDCLSMKSDWSKGLQPDFRKEPGPSVGQETLRCDSMEEQLSRYLSSDRIDPGLQEVLDDHKISLKRRCEHVNEGSDEAGSSQTLLNRIFTELYITEGLSEEVNTQP
ncbi:NLR family CARD domain-containing protein 3-like [Xyrichtys novacula]|uniref:NLR family CARD domain-containing protein 3-like n=1 Tax=Xyrichtys novacula TaxID=13765 RepID=A0AAV1ESV8_XYRNO|nr:NLR family CARD domain-containing protein 3-like [Xyrichtys novacula]